MQETASSATQPKTKPGLGEPGASPKRIALTSCTEPVNFASIFGRVAPVHVDLGCGDGLLLSQLAQWHPQENFLGIERLLGRVRSACRKARGVPNLRVLQLETTYAVRYLLPPESVSVFYFLFPDPWPKRRHHRRRVFNDDFLEALIKALQAGGRLRIATDYQDYFEKMTECVRKRSELQAVTESDDLPLTTFEKRFRAAGQPIYRLDLRKTSPGR